jgi:hypothetical protein
MKYSELLTSLEKKGEPLQFSKLFSYVMQVLDQNLGA